jgi:pyrroloquinoline quinone biosynthesis protein E
MGDPAMNAAAVTPGPPLWLLAELTYACPLHCVFCSNPVDFAKEGKELSTDDWARVLREARELGAVQLGFSGGEPLMREDLESLVGVAHELGYYTNLITSGVGLTEARIGALNAAGLDHIQLSFQDSTRELNDFLSHTRTFDLKRRTAALIKAHGFPMVLNCVIHRLNIDHIDRVIDLALEIGAEYLELANAQYYGWAFLNRDHLLPTRAQIDRAQATVERYRERIGDGLRILLVVPDYHERRPKRCMNGWGAVFLTITPEGTALPCQAAKILPGIDFPSVRESTIRDIWYDSDAFNRFRGDAWMAEPCRSCPEKAIDLGGCRCQAFLLTGSAEAADPVCDKSPDHARVLKAIESAATTPVQPLVFRAPEASRRLMRLPSGPK